MSAEPPRRDFLKKAFWCSLALGGTRGLGPLLPAPALAAVPVASGPTLGVARNGTPTALALAAVGVFGGMKKFVGRGDIVVVKPNIGWDRTPEQAANANPEVVKAVVRMCLDAGAKKVTVMDRPCNDPRRCYQRSGIEEAVLSLGDPAAVIQQMDERRFVPRPVTNAAGTTRDWLLYQDLLEADKRINIPIAKHHSAARLTLSLKNIMGIVGGNRGNIHHDLDGIIADLNTMLKFDLVVLDAVRILTANGPQGGRLQDVKQIDTVVAGTDPVAVDAYAATFFGLTGYDIPHVVNAARAGLGEIDLKKVRISTVNPG